MCEAVMNICVKCVFVRQLEGYKRKGNNEYFKERLKRNHAGKEDRVLSSN